MILGRGEVRFDGDEPDLGAYRIVVLQTPAQQGWLDLIPELQAGGTKVVFDADYDMHAIAARPGRSSRGSRRCSRMCDGVICATRYIAERYAPLQPEDVRLRERHRSRGVRADAARRTTP